jgi:hypothetical protein
LLIQVFYGIIEVMKSKDENKEWAEKKLSISDFLKCYNQNLPSGLPNASLNLLKEFKKTYPALFDSDNSWSLDKHRKKFMDWPTQRTRSNSN